MDYFEIHGPDKLAIVIGERRKTVDITNPQVDITFTQLAPFLDPRRAPIRTIYTYEEGFGPVNTDADLLALQRVSIDNLFRVLHQTRAKGNFSSTES